MSSPHVYDPGMQPERSALAWRRTVLAVAVGSLIAIRLLAPYLGLGSLVIGGVGFGAAVLVWVLAARRNRTVQRELRSGRVLPGGGLPLLLALLVSAGAAVGIGYALTA